MEFGRGILSEIPRLLLDAPASGQKTPLDEAMALGANKKNINKTGGMG